MTIRSPALPQVQPSEEKEKVDFVLSARLTVETAGPEAWRKSVPGGDPSCGVQPCAARGSLCRDSVSGRANADSPTCPTGQSPWC
jgi:hypothetical protein